MANANPARIILQNRESMLYVKAADHWTPHIQEASDFCEIVKALDFVRQTKLPAMDVIMSFGNPNYDIRLKATN